ncbi:hypothetical protein [Pseudoxanthobacter sp.]|uniref:hypothetical protein n=1 Tax=Pseudoxanthobacter sp. TaxID=1925742 RepID=UPI002FDF4640
MSGRPAGDLLQARRAIAAFARALAGLPDAALDGAHGGRLRAAAAAIGCGARSLANAIAFARTGLEPEGSEAAPVPAEAMARAATLPAAALRNLCTHAHAHLDAEWRDLDAAGWQVPVQAGEGPPVAAAETPRLWTAALMHATGVLAAAAA